LVKALPGEPIIVAMSVGSLPKDFVKLLEEAMKSSPTMKMLNKSIGLNFGMDFLDLTGAMGGDMVVLLSNIPSPSRDAIQKGTAPLPGITMAMTIDSVEIYKKLIDMIPQGMAVQKEDYLQVNFGDYPFYSGKFGRNWVITTDAKVIRESGYESGKSLADTEIGESITDHGTYLFWDLNPDLYPRGILTEATQSEEGFIADHFLHNWKLFNYFEIIGEDATQVEANLHLNDDSENSLFLILKEIDRQASEVI